MSSKYLNTSEGSEQSNPLECNSNIKPKKNTYLLVGWTGHGKSTTGNIILNKSGETECLNKPLETSAYAAGCTSIFQVKESDNAIVIDTVGFGDSRFNEEEILKDFRRALEIVDYKIHCVIYVLMKGRFSKYNIQFFQHVQNTVLLGKCKYNSFLLITGANEKWVIESLKTDSNLQDAIDNCDGKYYCLNLRFDDDVDQNEQKLRNQKSINEFIKFTFEFFNSFKINTINHYLSEETKNQTSNYSKITSSFFDNFGHSVESQQKNDTNDEVDPYEYEYCILKNDSRINKESTNSKFFEHELTDDEDRDLYDYDYQRDQAENSKNQKSNKGEFRQTKQKCFPQSKTKRSAEIDLSVIKTKEYEKHWYEKAIPMFKIIAIGCGVIAAGATAIASAGATATITAAATVVASVATVFSTASGAASVGFNKAESSIKQSSCILQ